MSTSLVGLAMWHILTPEGHFLSNNSGLENALVQQDLSSKGCDEWVRMELPVSLREVNKRTQCTH